ncbi:MAG: adenylate/guanylate cyclase domain-containing protein [Chitinophagales bacterium]
MNLLYQIAEKTLASSPTKSADYAHRASMLASELGEKRRESESIYLSADALMRSRKWKEASSRFNWAWNTARNYGHRDMALLSAEKLQEIARKNSDEYEELKWAREVIGYLKESSGRSGGVGDAGGKLTAQLAALESENTRLKGELERLSGQSQEYESAYKATEEQYKQEQEKIQTVISQKEEELTQIAQQKLKTDSLLGVKAKLIASMSADQMADAMLLAQQERTLQEQQTQIAESELANERQQNIQNLLAAFALFVLVLAVLFFIRFRAKQRTANELSEKNRVIEEEQKRSDGLLLNILPPAIAQELKQKNRVAARLHERATVMFIDFTGFTHVSEKLTPEALVRELDFCFSNFDRIISQYRIEKIKTVGDAYICASGLSDMNASPSDMIKAALEIQDFLLHVKAERQGQGLPYFEARCGIHTGPVVAGVVGAKKFAYDIWGDTVNIAARMEETCEPGRVNISEDTYWLAKYEFEWINRGKVAAKNKGMMDMFYVASLKL